MSSRPGRPRSEKTRLAILEAAADLMLEKGFYDTTIEAIANRAGVSKVTIYKWWPGRGAVAIDAYFHRFMQTTVFPDTGDVELDIRTQVLHLIETFRGRAGEVMAELLGYAQFDANLSEVLRERWLQPRRASSTAVLQRGIERGVIRSGASVSIILDEIYGAIYFRLMTRHLPLNGDFATELVHNVLSGVQTASV
ncbi:MAG TPA: TetR/AcrR family transcriptional regulator [Acidimicrobiales bacterium]